MKVVACRKSDICVNIVINLQYYRCPELIPKLSTETDPGILLWVLKSDIFFSIICYFCPLQSANDSVALHYHSSCYAIADKRKIKLGALGSDMQNMWIFLATFSVQKKKKKSASSYLFLVGAVTNNG